MKEGNLSQEFDRTEVDFRESSKYYPFVFIIIIIIMRLFFLLH